MATELVISHVASSSTGGLLSTISTLANGRETSPINRDVMKPHCNEVGYVKPIIIFGYVKPIIIFGYVKPIIIFGWTSIHYTDKPGFKLLMVYSSNYRPLAVSSRAGRIKTLAVILFWPKMYALFRICIFITYE